jgi:hypothetical protein
MLERNQLHPLVERVLAQAGPATGHGLEPTVFLHAAGGWVVQGLDVGSSERVLAGLNDLVETGKVHDADAYVCVAHRNDLGPLAEALGTERPAPDGDAVAVIAQSRVGDRVCGTATEADGWTVDESGCEPFRELREQLTAMLLPRA